jgi:hypothetical protein
MTISAALNFSELNLDGSHVIAKKGGESVAYQGRKKAKTTNILPITDGHGFIIATTGLIAGNHNDAYNLKSHLRIAFKSIRRLDLNIQGAFLNADRLLIPLLLVKPASTMGSSPISMKTSAIRRTSSGVANAYSTRMFINIASQARNLLLGLINLELY